MPFGSLLATGASLECRDASNTDEKNCTYGLLNALTWRCQYPSLSYSFILFFFFLASPSTSLLPLSSAVYLCPPPSSYSVTIPPIPSLPNLALQIPPSFLVSLQYTQLPSSLSPSFPSRLPLNTLHLTYSSPLSSSSHPSPSNAAQKRGNERPLSSVTRKNSDADHRRTASEDSRRS